MSDSPTPGHSVSPTQLEGRNICVIYDCLFPLTYGGAERWYRVLVDRFVETGATVTYLTRRQWPLQPPAWTGVNIVAVGGDSELYDSEGTRRTGPAMMFGIGTFIWLLRHRRKFDAVVVASFPYFSLLAARAALVGTSTPIFVDYLEVWSPQYWKFYAGRVTGTLGVIVQKLCIRVTQFAQVFVEENAQRLRAMDYRGDVAVLAGLLPGDRIRSVASESPPEGPTVLFVGRHVKHKGVRLLPAILSVARESIPDLKMTIVSDGPERSAVEREVHELGLNDYVTFAGPVSDDDLPQIFANASCTVVPSLREGYGIVVVESVSAGTPVVVANNPENLATGLVAEGINGFVVEPSIRAMAEGIVTAIVAGAPLRHSAADWSVQHSAEKSINRSADEMVERISTVSNRQSK